MFSININYGLNDSNIVRIINFCLLKLEFNNQNKKITNLNTFYSFLYSISRDENNIKDKEEFFYRIEKILLKKYHKHDIWKVIVILIPLSRLCNVDIGYLIGTNIIKLSKKYNLETERDIYNILNLATQKLKVTDNDYEIDKLSDLIVTCILLVLELSSFNGRKEFDLNCSENTILIWLTGYGNYLKYDNKISSCMEIINCGYKYDEIMDKLFLILKVVYDIEVENYKDINEEFNWERISEEIFLRIL
ncbi:MAG: hypothetical protein RBR70_11775 [Arcobacter sp.]|uniref:hypothetical protein n=1 Tax=Arcobacter sp. TaxID=1872629 RepID=UPI0025888AF8|nr:hypothetical protein [Arcobacter sp.]MDD3007546.1 hypothetical protein [Arcobacter sp.]MDY3205741.1 hypothetical protein [Arcobacter sp.]